MNETTRPDFFGSYALSLGLKIFQALMIVVILTFMVGFRDGATGRTAVIRFIAGNVFYYAIGIGLAYALKNNRAFCKYVCPVSVLLKVVSRLSLFKIGSTEQVCNNCATCVKMYPMDVRIPEYVLNGQRVLSTECGLCQTCVTVCAREALKLSFGFDLGGKDLLRERHPAVRPGREGTEKLGAVS